MHKFNPRTFRYTPQLMTRKDRTGNVRTVAVRFDNDAGSYVATIDSQNKRNRMADGTNRGEIIALGEGRTVEDAIDRALHAL